MAPKKRRPNFNRLRICYIRLSLVANIVEGCRYLYLSIDFLDNERQTANSCAYHGGHKSFKTFENTRITVDLVLVDQVGSPTWTAHNFLRCYAQVFIVALMENADSWLFIFDRCQHWDRRTSPQNVARRSSRKPDLLHVQKILRNPVISNVSKISRPLRMFDHFDSNTGCCMFLFWLVYQD